MDLLTYRKQFKKYFPKLNPNKFLDPVFHLTGKISVDICLLDDYLHAEYGNYETEKGWSMKDCIFNHYGQTALNFIVSIM